MHKTVYFTTEMIIILSFMIFVSAQEISKTEWTDSQKDFDGGLNLNESFFGKLQNYHIDADQIPETKYPWIAKVLHSISFDYPVICTASCIGSRLFVTAARCIRGLVPRYTRLIYRNIKLSVTAFVVPSNETKQEYDDIGFIITNREWSEAYSTIKILNIPRNDKQFRWFAETSFNDPYVVIGYATLKGYYNVQYNTNFNLTELSVVININLCNNILTLSQQINAFHVPCYHSCTLEQFENEDEKCNRYHGVEGGAVVNTKTNKLLGVTTWGAQGRRVLPVGFAPLNGKIFADNLLCGQKIAGNHDKRVPGLFQRVCDNAIG